ncbi:hypothetical protein NM208_g11101 [Fusarium decemcellulare]|uniref:Uncharacterized protein n=1 Tax=Fusarium decemcellulare TaxID=57161 RepID=A0ACC1RVI2_9HYPO|nr:hypothetical protein NM208_g11101 [Fusarium decemcellulare]
MASGGSGLGCLINLQESSYAIMGIRAPRHLLSRCSREVCRRMERSPREKPLVCTPSVKGPLASSDRMLESNVRVRIRRDRRGVGEEIPLYLGIDKETFKGDSNGWFVEGPRRDTSRVALERVALRNQRALTGA